MKPGVETETVAETCECGNPQPCDLHTTVYDQQLAYQALRRLTATQRAQVLVWFCRWCHRYLAPGQPRRGCDQGECLQKKITAKKDSFKKGGPNA